MRIILKDELTHVSGGVTQVHIPHQKIDTGKTAVALSSISSKGPTGSGGVRGGSSSSSPVPTQPVQPPVVVCIDVQTQVCTTGGGVTGMSFGTSGVSMTRVVPSCTTTLSTHCTSTRNSR